MPKLLTSLKIWTHQVRQAWKPPDEVTVSQWADRNRQLDAMTSAEPGQWRTDRTPYLREIMDCFSNPLVENITLMTSTQVGKTESMYNMLGYAIDQDPAPALLVMPREPDAKQVSQDRVEPMLKLSPALRPHITRNSDDLTKLELKLARMILYFAGANSPAALSGKPVRYLFLDETDKYPKFSGEEADPVKLATERTRTYWNRKIVKCSTPTVANGYINREYERSDQRRYYVPCPHCTGYQPLIFSQIKVPETERDPERIKQGRLAWYECIYCKGKVTDIMKQKMLLRGTWLPASIQPDPKGALPEKINIPPTSHVGFHLNALYSPWLTFSEIIAEWFSCQGRVELLMNFVNSWLAEIWQEKVEETKPDQLRKLCRPYKKGTVPERGIVLFAGVDVQKLFFAITIRVFGPYPESWLVREEIVTTWDEVEEIVLNTQYPSVVEGIDPFPVRLAAFDTGYRTSEVYNFVREHQQRARAIKGKDQLTGVPYKVSKIDKHPSGTPIPGGLLLWNLDTTYFKDKLAYLIQQENGKWHLHESPSEQYFSWFCAEHKVLTRNKKKGTTHEMWQRIRSSVPSHFWDAEIYGMAAAEMLGAYTLKEADVPVATTPQTAGPGDTDKSPWLGRRSNWIRRA